jgi:HEAT repeat protein
LITAFKDTDYFCQSGAVEALGKIGAPAVEPLIAAMKDVNPLVQRSAASGLGSTKDPRAVEPLIAATKDPNYGVRTAAANALSEIKDPRAVHFLLAAWKERDMAVIDGAHNFFIARHERGSDDVLIQMLDESGNSSIAQDFLNSGNRKLENAARAWAARHRITIVKW